MNIFDLTFVGASRTVSNRNGSGSHGQVLLLFGIDHIGESDRYLVDPRLGDRDPAFKISHKPNKLDMTGGAVRNQERCERELSYGRELTARQSPHLVASRAAKLNVAECICWL